MKVVKLRSSVDVNGAGTGAWCDFCLGPANRHGGSEEVE